MRILALGLLLLASNLGATPLLFTSGDRQVNVVELFTSEGCSSCPPAERWLNTLSSETRLWRDFVPVAFHVDYWDYIGWQDSFARSEFNARQRQYAAEGGADFVYTPGVFRNGKEWLGWRSGEAVIDKHRRGHELSLHIDGKVVHATYQSPGSQPLQLNVALLGMGLETEVRAGENQGRTLTHDFVALAFDSMPLGMTGTHYELEFTLPTSAINAKREALVAWVSLPDAQTPLQATGGYIN